MNTIGVILYAINGLIPFVFTLILYKRFKEKKKPFYLFWLTGFSAYGLASLINAYMFLNETVPPVFSLLFSIFTLIAFICIVTGVGELFNRALAFFLVSLGAPIIILILSVLGRVSYSLDLIFMIPYLIMTMGLVALQLLYRVNFGYVILGWVLILIANIGYSTGNISFMAAPIISILGKTVVFYWMTRPRFSMITEEFKEFMKTTIPDSTVVMDSFITMVETNSSKDNLGWVLEQVKNSHETGIRTILFWVEKDEETQDYSKLEEYSNIYIFRVIEGFRTTGKVFSERTMEVANNIDELNSMIYDIMDYVRENEATIQLFFYDVSYFIKRTGWRRVYSQMISLIPQLKASNSHVYFIYNMENGENKQEIEIIRLLADRVIDIRD